MDYDGFIEDEARNLAGLDVHRLPAGTKLLICGPGRVGAAIAAYLLNDAQVLLPAEPAPQPVPVVVVGAPSSASIIAQFGRTTAEIMRQAQAEMRLINSMQGRGIGKMVEYREAETLRNLTKDELRRHREMNKGWPFDLTAIRGTINDGLDLDQLRQDLAQLQLPKEATPRTAAKKEPFRGYSNHRRRW